MRIARQPLSLAGWILSSTAPFLYGTARRGAARRDATRRGRIIRSLAPIRCSRDTTLS